MNEAIRDAHRHLGLKAPTDVTEGLSPHATSPGQGTLTQRTAGTPLAHPEPFDDLLDGVMDPHGMGMQRYLEIAHMQGPSYPATPPITVEDFYIIVDTQLDIYGPGSWYHRTVHQEPQEQPRIP